MKHAFRECAVGQTVWARNYRGTAKWVGGEILEQLRPVSYKVIVSGGERKRHADQLRDRTENLGQKHSNETMTTLPDVQFQEDRVSDSAIPQSISIPTTVPEDGAREQEEATGTGQEKVVKEEIVTQDQGHLRRSSRQRKAPDRLDL